MAGPLIRFRAVTKVYGSGDAAVAALKGVDLGIERGEFVAVMGPSGSGKSTAMNILGCLDTPTSGSYEFMGAPVGDLSRDQQALLRRHYLGFVFQGFNLLPRTSALENVEMPLMYRGVPAGERKRLALAALTKVGLEHRANHDPNELSGGQQQRVAIARAIAAEPQVVLADEPTGNLDSATSKDVMNLLTDLNRRDGITIVMVTHEPDMAAYAQRVIRFVDGHIAADGPHEEAALMLYETLKLSIRTIRRNVLRSILTVLGVVIGVAAVIVMVTLGQGTSAQVTSDVAKLGSNILMVRAGQAGFGPASATADSRNFDAKDVDAVENEIAGVAVAAPMLSRNLTAISGNINHAQQVIGTDNRYFVARDWDVSSGRTFTDGEIQAGSAACILGATTSQALFQGGDPVGETIRLRAIACKVIGVLAAKGNSGFGQDQDDLIVMPLKAVQRRIAGHPDIQLMYVSVDSAYKTSDVQASIEDLLRERRQVGPDDRDNFSVQDMAQIASMLTSISGVLTGLLSAVAGVSLLVGGIGIMNIMLVSVTERTREIGIRLAIGAQARQVLLQFLVEAVVLSLFGGVLGIALGLGLAAIGGRFLSVPFIFNPTIVAIAFLFSALVGVAFGYFPARRAARLDPIEALRHE